MATWVVDSEYPKWLDKRMADADDASAAMPWGDSISVRPLPMVRMTRQPPDPGAQADGQGAGHDHPGGRLGSGVQGPFGDQGQGDDPHGLLGVVGAMGQRHHRGRTDLADPEPVGAGRPLAPPASSRYTHQVPIAAMPKAMNGDSTPGMITLETSPCHFTACEPGRRQGGADHPADEGVRGTGRDTEIPGQQVPGDPPAQARRTPRSG